jgi:hypothetical protein
MKPILVDLKPPKKYKIRWVIPQGEEIHKNVKLDG